MKKNILLLINGFGIERGDSYNVYNAEVMPNMDRLTREGLFGTFTNKNLDFKSAYRNLSMGIDNPLTYSLVENSINDNSLEDNELLKYIINQTVLKKSRLHIMCFWESERTLEHLNYILNIVKKQNISRIFIHLILCHKSVNDYKEIDRGLNVLNYDSASNIKIGVVSGENNFYDLLNARDLVKNFMTEFGEKWKDLSKKVAVLVQTKTVPCDTRTFSVNPTYRFENNDQVLFLNYNNIDITKFRNELLIQKYRQVDFNTIQFYSLFPIRADIQIPFMFNYAVSANYTLDSLSKASASCLVFDKKDNCSFINYYLTGLRNTIDERLKYVPTDDGFIYDANRLLTTIQSYNRDLYIINYNIDDCKTLESLKERLNKIDGIIGILDKYVSDNNYALFISSLYGMETQMYNQKQELVKINFSGKSPLVVDDNKISSTNYNIVEGNLCDMMNSIISNINPYYKSNGMIRKKSSLLSFLYKKPKGSKEK